MERYHGASDGIMSRPACCYMTNSSHWKDSGAAQQRLAFPKQSLLHSRLPFVLLHQLLCFRAIHRVLSRLAFASPSCCPGCPVSDHTLLTGTLCHVFRDAWARYSGVRCVRCRIRVNSCLSGLVMTGGRVISAPLVLAKASVCQLELSKHFSLC